MEKPTTTIQIPIPIFTCKCGAVPRLTKNALFPPLWKVVCTCGRTGMSECVVSKAVQNWNSGYLKVV